MKLPSPIVAGSIAVAVFAGGFAVGHFVTDDSGSNTAQGKPQVLGEVFSNNPNASTSTTAATLPSVTPGTQPSANTTTTAPRSAQTKTVIVTQTQSSPPATTTVVVTNADCGTGTATASVASKTFPREKTANTDYETDATATIHNGVDKPIQIDSLAIRLFYEDGTTQDVVFTAAIGNVLQPGVTNNYSVAINTGQRPVQTTGLQSFATHTAGHPECSARPA
jgi:hypothetical protein